MSIEDNVLPPRTVVISAFACEPGRGSEPGTGFEFARAAAYAARKHGWRCVLVTRGHRADAIRRELAEHSLESELEIVPVHLPRMVVNATGRRHVRVAYLIWQVLAYLKLRKTIDLHAPGVVFHHVTFATEALPTMARFLPQGVHVVLGPFGSAVSAGPAPLTKRVARWSRGAIARWNLGRADVAIAQNDDVYAAIRTRARAKLYLEPNAVVDLTPSPEDREVPCVDLSGVCHDPRTVRPIVVAGRLIPRKRVDLAIAAMALLRGNGTQMWIIGDGPELGALRAQVEALRLEDQVHFFGEIPRAHLLDVLRMASVLVHLSSQEGAGWVVAEAQSAGAVPVVVKGSGADTVVRLGGFGEVVSEAKPALVAASIECAAASHPAPTSRWSSDRIVDLLPIWYSGAWKDPKGEHA